jgi:hypothetical protein
VKNSRFYALLLIAVQQPAFPSTPPSASDIAACDGAANLSIASLRPDQVTDILGIAQKQRDGACKSVEDALLEQNRITEEISNVVPQFLNALSTTAAEIDVRVEHEILQFQKMIQDARDIKEVSDENNAKLRSIKGSFDQSEQNTRYLDRDWDSLFKPAVGGPVARVLRLEADGRAPPDIAKAIGDLLNRTPPYFLGRAPTPREKIDFLIKEMEQAREVLRLEDQKYGQSLIDQSNQALQHDLGPENLALSFDGIRLTQIAAFSYRTMSWATRAAQEGACDLVQGEFRDQVSALQLIPTRMDPSSKGKLAEALKPEIEDRRSFLATMQCDSDKLISSLQLWKHRIPLFCKGNVSIGVQDRVNTGVRDIDILTGAWSKSADADHRSAIQKFAAEVWDQLYGLAKECGTRY